MSEEEDKFSEFPNEIVLEIFNEINLSELINMSFQNKRFFHLIKNTDNDFWKINNFEFNEFAMLKDNQVNRLIALRKNRPIFTTDVINAMDLTTKQYVFLCITNCLEFEEIFFALRKFIEENNTKAFLYVFKRYKITMNDIKENISEEDGWSLIDYASFLGRKNIVYFFLKNYPEYDWLNVLKTMNFDKKNYEVIKTIINSNEKILEKIKLSTASFVNLQSGILQLNCREEDVVIQRFKFFEENYPEIFDDEVTDNIYEMAYLEDISYRCPNLYKYLKDREFMSNLSI